MFKVAVKSSIIKHCENQIDLYDFGKRFTANGTKKQQLTGIIGQSVIMDLLGLGLIDGKNGFDNGTDIELNGIKIDVKTMGRTTDVRDYYVNNFLGLQMYFDTDAYIFCSLNKNTNELTVCGWVTKSELKEKASFFPKGTIRYRSNGTAFQTFADLYEIANNDLNNVDSLDELRQELSSIK
ncbi:MAG: hypothetical protein IKO46_00765 [Salinivirgaceae bacterium]|nr:hypothetical protein [Salinivirgaceae bacterium]